jgi:hypothetical protein
MGCLVTLFFTVHFESRLAAGDGDEAGKDEEAALLQCVTFYASFDEAVKGDFGGGDLAVFSGVRPSADPVNPAPSPRRGFDAKVFSISKNKGIAGGCLHATDVLPNNGRILFPAKGNIAFKKGGWGGAVSFWIKTDPDKMLKTKFCDPVQITEKGADNGGIWVDFNDARPRALRHGAFPFVPEGSPRISEDDPHAPMVRVPAIGFRAGDWHHVVVSWRNFDTRRRDAVSALYIDGQRMGEVKGAIAMNWSLEKTGVYFAVNYIGLLDELAIFNRPLTKNEVRLLQNKPTLLIPLKKKG